MLVLAKSTDEVEICLADYNGNAEKVNGNYNFQKNASLSSASPHEALGLSFNFIKDATSDGNTFLVPAFNVTQDKNKGKIVNENAAAEVAVPYREVKSTIEENPDTEIDYHYHSYELYMRSKSPNIRIEDSSYVISKLESENTNGAALMSDTSGNPAHRPAISYGLQGHEFSKDALVGAIRVSLVGQPWGTKALEGYTSANYETYRTSSDTTLQFLWLPRPDIKLNIGSTIGSWTVDTGLTDTSGDNFKHTFYKAVGADSVKPVTLTKGSNTVDGNTYYLDVSDPTIKTTSTATPVPTLGASRNITNFSGTPVSRQMDGETYYVYRYTLNIWIEGTDAEARRAMGDGQFRINLSIAS